MGVGGQHHIAAPVPPGMGPGTHCTGSWVGSRAGAENLPAYSSFVYSLHYCDPSLSHILCLKTECREGFLDLRVRRTVQKKTVWRKLHYEKILNMYSFTK